MEIQDHRVSWDIFGEDDCFQTVEAYLQIGDVVPSNNIAWGAARVLFDGELELFLELQRVIDRLREERLINLDGPLDSVISFMKGTDWLEFTKARHTLMNSLLDRGVPGLAEFWRNEKGLDSFRQLGGKFAGAQAGNDETERSEFATLDVPDGAGIDEALG